MGSFIFSFTTQKMSFHCILDSLVSDKKSAIIYIVGPMDIIFSSHLVILGISLFTWL